MKSIKEKVEFAADCDYIENDNYYAFKRGAECGFKFALETLRDSKWDNIYDHGCEGGMSPDQWAEILEKEWEKYDDRNYQMQR